MRIGSNVLPTKEILAHRIQNIDTSYCLGKEPMETSVHLFFKCLVVRAIWFGCQWSIRAEHLQVSTHDDILKLVLDLPLPSQPSKNSSGAMHPSIGVNIGVYLEPEKPSYAQWRNYQSH
uniref:Reverse transcriptase zinc-binding domain-containing protein n=1 Tax=Fagus sylvatica TaxID=28930 RepID=A0A2N9FCB1_FAGSY